MLSSVFDDKPVVASTWLERLRLNRGLTITEDDDVSGNPLSLDDFLRRNQLTETEEITVSDSPPSGPIPSDPELAESPSEPNRGEWYGVISDVLHELFNFGDSSSRNPAKKLPRKQSNPRHCSVDTLPDAPPLNQKRDASFREFATSSRNSNNKKPAAEKRERRRSVEEEEAEEVEEEEKGEKDLVGFSRSEVTVIDTSFKIWKSEKLVFRRRNVWKVRDKKGKSRVVSSKKKTMKKKKRKCDVDDDDDDDDDEIVPKTKKKMKLSSEAQYLIEEARDELEIGVANQALLCRLASKARKERQDRGGSWP